MTVEELEEVHALEQSFRRGAAHSTQWLTGEVKSMAAAGRLIEEIVERIVDLNEVVVTCPPQTGQL